MQLKTGFYFISTIATSPWGERWVQRDTVEDKTMLPKPVNIQVNEAGAAEVPTYLLKPRIPPAIPDSVLLTQGMPQWYVEQVDGNRFFKLSAGAIDVDPAPTVDQDGKLFADISGGSATNWTVTECETCDEGVFM